MKKIISKEIGKFLGIKKEWKFKLVVLDIYEDFMCV